MPRSSWSIGFGLVLVAVGVTWMVSNVVDFDVPWEWIVPALITAFGLGMMFIRRPAIPASQFERADAPRVP